MMMCVELLHSYSRVATCCSAALATLFAEDGNPRGIAFVSFSSEALWRTKRLLASAVSGIAAYLQEAAVQAALKLNAKDILSSDKVPLRDKNGTGVPGEADPGGLASAGEEQERRERTSNRRALQCSCFELDHLRGTLVAGS